MIKSREMGGRKQREGGDRYMHLQRDTEVVEDIDGDDN